VLAVNPVNNNVTDAASDLDLVLHVSTARAAARR
jgi:hypothetical protein